MIIKDLKIKDCTLTEINGDLLVKFNSDDSVIKLNPTARLIWEQLIITKNHTELDLTKIKEIIEAEYSIMENDKSILLEDIIDFINQLKDIGLIEFKIEV